MHFLRVVIGVVCDPQLIVNRSIELSAGSFWKPMTEIISVWPYDREPECKVQHFNLKTKKSLRFIGICLQMPSHPYLSECLPT